ncbi:hypothetical protein AgCh_038713 [Apium graveolens]
MKTEYLHSSLFLVSLLLIPLSYVSSAPPDPNAFLQCLARNNVSDEDTKAIVFSPHNPMFTSVLNSLAKNLRFQTPETPKPVVIVTPKIDSHVQSTIACAKEMKIQLKTRSGGHDYDGRSYTSNETFLILDMFNMKRIDVFPETETAVVEAGATLGEVYYNIWNKSKIHAFPAGVCPTVGAGGHISCGGYGTLIRKYGLTVDNVIDARIVNVNGEILDRKGMGEDLFWAIRGGGGGSFGVILSYTIHLVKVPEVVTTFKIMKTLEENGTDIVYQYQVAVDKMDPDLFIRLLLQPGDKTVKVTLLGEFLGDCNRLVGIMNQEIPQVGFKNTDCMQSTWIKSKLWWANFDNNTAPEALLVRNSSVTYGKRKSDYVQTPIPKEGLEAIWKKMLQLGTVGFVFNSYGGKMNEPAATDTPMPHRAGNLYKIQYSTSWSEPGPDADNKYMSNIRSLHEFMTPYVSQHPRGAFLCYRDLDIGTTDNGIKSFDQGMIYGMQYFGPNFDRLVKIKTAVDPENFFRNEQSIPVHHQGTN